MKPSSILVKVPASTANMGPGFDTLGMALTKYAWIGMSQAQETKIHLHGDEVAGISVDKSNLIYEVAQMVFQDAGIDMPELEISMYSEIPLTRGMGSSASAIIGGMVAANALAGYPLDDQRIFQLATAIEQHPDNVGASLFGGIIVATWDGVQAEHIRIEPPQNLAVMVAVPSFHLSTSSVRDVLPTQYSMKDAVYNISRSSLLVAALGSGELSMIRHAMSDRLHQPYRSAFIPGMERILQEATDHGALGVALSGAGPTLLALVDEHSTRKAELQQYMLDVFASENVEAAVMWLKPDLHGVRVLTPFGDHSTFIEKVREEEFV